MIITLSICYIKTHENTIYLYRVEIADRKNICESTIPTADSFYSCCYSLSPHITHQATRYPSGKIVGRHPSRGPHRQSTTTPTNQSRYLGIQKTSLASHPTDNKSKADIKSREAGADRHESGGRCISPCSKRTYGEGCHEASGQGCETILVPTMLPNQCSAHVVLGPIPSPQLEEGLETMAPVTS
jgi:hypothetical protein